MILIRERRKRTVYEIEDLNTGAKKTWCVPLGIQKNTEAINAALRAVCINFEKEQKIGESNTDTYLPSTEITSEMPLAVYANEVFMRRRIVTIAENTRDFWQRAIDNRIALRIGHIPIGKLTANDCLDFLISLQAEGLAYSTVTKYRQLLKLILDMAYATDIIPKNPMEKIGRLRRRADELADTDIPAFQPSDIIQIRNALSLHASLKWQCLVNILIDTGMRAGECCGLKWSDISFDKKEILIQRTICYTTKQGVFESPTKNRKNRIARLSDDVWFLLVQWYSASKASDSQWVFHQKDAAKPINPQTPGKFLRKFGKTHNIQNLHPHKFRHTVASLTLAGGADPVSVAFILGHSNPAVTLQWYAASNQDSIRKTESLYWDAIKDKTKNE